MQAMADSQLVSYDDIYEHNMDRWESDVEWCADMLGADRLEFLRECRENPKS
jgi:hypothetical protein